MTLSPSIVVEVTLAVRVDVYTESTAATGDDVRTADDGRSTSTVTVPKSAKSQAGGSAVELPAVASKVSKYTAC